MAGPKKSPRPKARPKIVDVSPRAERKEREEVMGSSGITKSPRPKARPKIVDVSPRAERNEREEVMGKACGGSMKKMAKGGVCRGMGAATRGGNFYKNG